MRRHITQREAHRLFKRVSELEAMEAQRRRRWASQWPGGTQIASAKWELNDMLPVAVRTARKCGHAVVAIANDDDGLVRLIALPHPKDELE